MQFIRMKMKYGESKLGFPFASLQAGIVPAFETFQNAHKIIGISMIIKVWGQKAFRDNLIKSRWQHETHNLWLREASQILLFIYS